MPLRNHTPACLADIIVNLLRGKWAMHILHKLTPDEPLHFNAILRSIPGISAKVLNEQLGYLTAGGVLQRLPTASARQEVLYAYTELGKELRLVVDKLNDLAARWQVVAGNPAPAAQADGDVGRQSAPDLE